MMPRFNPEDLASWSHGEWSSLPERPISGFSIDTRNLGNGDVFVAIKDQRDGHDFLSVAKSEGATGAMVSRVNSELGFPQLLTKDTLSAFHMIAKMHRRNFSGSVVGITGSCGKTSTKEMLSVLLGKERTVSTKGNLNNHLGVPLSLLSIDLDSDDFAVIEAGINQTGEMSVLADMINPDFGIITNIGSSHLEGLFSEEIVAQEKSEIFRSVENLKMVFFPEHCLEFEEFKEFHHSSSDCSMVLVEGRPSGKLEKNKSYFEFRTETNTTGNSSSLRLERDGFPVLNLKTCLMSKGMGSNLALALLAAMELGITEKDFFERLPQYAPSTMRGKVLSGRGRAYYVDCYNANPTSMRDSLSFFSESQNGFPKLYVMGGMEELGESEIQLHQSVGQSINLKSKDLVILIGEKAGWMSGGILKNGASTEQVVLLQNKEDARSIIEDFDGSVLFKGSRSSRLESLVPEWAV